MANWLPSDCALFVCVPLNQQDFESDYCNSDKEYARLRRSWVRYRPTADLLRQTIESVSSLGVKPFVRTPLGELSAIVTSYKAVTIVAHSRFECLRNGDILAPAHIVEHLKMAETPLISELRAELDKCSPTWRALLEQRGPTALDLCRHLGKIVGLAHLWFKRLGTVDAKRSELRRTQTTGEERFNMRFGPAPTFTRPRVDLMFSGLIREGRPIELDDGFCSVSQLISNLPSNYNGTIDLSICHSAIFGDLIKEARPDSVSIRSKVASSPVIWRARYKEIIREIANTGKSYAEALVTVQRRLQSLPECS